MLLKQYEPIKASEEVSRQLAQEMSEVGTSIETEEISQRSRNLNLVRSAPLKLELTQLGENLYLGDVVRA